MIILKKKKIIIIAVILNVLVFLITMYILIFPAESHTFEDNIICRLAEHSHTDECFASYADDYGDKILICGITNENGIISHVHDSFCYDSMNNLICPIEKFVHTHDQSCFNQNNEQICGFVIHQHSEQCFSDMVNKEDYRLLICSQKAHIHRDSCYESAPHEEIQSVPLEDAQSEIYDIQSLNVDELEDKAAYSAENVVDVRSFDISGAIDLNEKNSDGTYKYIDNITVNYQRSDEWIEIDKEGGNNQNLPASADYRLEVSYNNISVDELEKSQHGGKLLLENIPDWLHPDENGEILMDSAPVASMQVQEGKVLITFYDSFFRENKNENGQNILHTLSGSFFVRGSVDWHKLNGNQGNIKLPTLDMIVQFENKLPQKMGRLSIEKLIPEIEYDSANNPYFRYKLTVRSLESDPDAVIPEVKVVDSFTLNERFVEEYCGITDNPVTLGFEKDGFKPFETRTSSSVQGTVKNADQKGICWEIGNLNPGEVCELTYFVKLDPSYIGSSSRGSIGNSAEALSSDIPKGNAYSEFIPRINAFINKTLDETNTHFDENGTGTITYKVEISAPFDNSYDLVNVRLHDFVDPKFDGFVRYPNTVMDSDKFTAVSNMTGMKNPSIDNPDDTSFNAVFPLLRRGETITVTYKIDVTNILLAGTGNIEFLNTAELFSEKSDSRGEASNHHFGSDQNIHTFEQSQWIRKLNGENLPAETTINIDANNAYEFNGSVITKAAAPPSSFTIPAGDKKYYVILNEEERWDLSSSAMKDSLKKGSDIVYKGWLCIKEFQQTGIENQTEDSTVLSKIINLVPSETVWLNIDGRDEFSFSPSDLGMSNPNSTYLLTYYAGIRNVEEAGSVMITNSFEVYDKIGVGGTYYEIQGIQVSVSSLVQGNIHYNVRKNPWYFSRKPDETGRVPIHNANDYNNGAIYWVIRVDGDINKGFRVRDIVTNKDSEAQGICSDSIAGIYKGPKSLDFTDVFHTYSEMLDNVGEGKMLEKLSGNITNPGSDTTLKYDKFQFNSLSDLDKQSLVIANFHSVYNDHSYGALSNEEKKGEASGNGTATTDGLKSQKPILENNASPVKSDEKLTEWTFTKVNEDESDNTFYIYSYVGKAVKYLNITGNGGNGGVYLSDEPVPLRISIISDKITITNEHGMALNWYGADGVYHKFCGYQSSGSDPNEKHTLLVPSDDYNNDDYSWFAPNSTDNIEVCFQKDMNLSDEEALYIVVRTALTREHGEFDKNTIFINGVESKQNSSSSTDWVHANDAQYILKTATPVFKEPMSKAFKYDGTNWINYNENDNDYDVPHFGDLVNSNVHVEPGIYVEWLINVNWDGSMRGMAEISDRIPDKLVPVFVCQHWIPDILKDPSLQPAYPIIEELESNDQWKKSMPATIPYYYNPTTHELRLRVDNLQKETDPLAINTKTVNIQLICRVEDPDILLSGVEKEIANTVKVVNNGIESENTGIVKLSPECSLTKEFNGNTYAPGKTSDKKLKFIIKVNPFGSNLGSNDCLPPLIDEFTENLMIVENSIDVQANGQSISGYTYDIKDNKLTFNKLPDKKELIITYEARTKADPDKNKDIKVSNMAYWLGHEPPQNWQVKDLVINYSMGGSINLTGTNPEVSIFKVDSENRAKRLEGASFELYKADGDQKIGYGSTDADGKLVFSSGLSFDTVYYIKETAAPEGYQLELDKKHYFVLLERKSSEDTSFNAYSGIDIWDSTILGEKYVCMIENTKKEIPKIRVDKTFYDENTGYSAPQSGKYSFGIFDLNPTSHANAKPLQILEIEYTDGTANYKLNNLQNDAPEFTIAQPDNIYYVFELDESQKPIFNGNYFSTNGNTYKVEYESQLSDCNEVSIVKNTISIRNQVAYFSLPDTGGMGLKKYYLIAGFFLITATLIAFKFKRNCLV